MACRQLFKTRQKHVYFQKSFLVFLFNQNLLLTRKLSFFLFRYVHHDKNAPAQQQQQLPPIQQLPTQQLQQPQPETVNGIEPLQQQQQQLQMPEQQQQQVMSNQALKVKCPFCELMFAARYAFYQHLCDKHFKDTLAQQVPVHPPYQCPVGGCAYIARDSRQSLIRHFGMTHKVIAELLKRHVPDYETIDPFPSDDQHQQQQQPIQQVQHQVDPMQQQQQQQQQVYYHHPAPQLQQQFGQQQDLQAAMMPGYYHQEYHPQQQQHHMAVQQQQHAVHQQPHAVYGQQHVGGEQQHMRFEPQIDGTFDPSHYSDHSLDGIRSIPTTPIKTAAAVMPPPQPATAVDADSLLLSLAAEQETEVLSTPSQQQPEVPQTNAEDETHPTIQVPATPAGAKGSPKICEICGKQFEGKNRAMLKVQHMANHFKEKLFADLKDKSAPFKCPMEGCSYQTKHKPDWARHYGSVHQFIGKYLKEYLDQHQQQPQQVEEPQQVRLQQQNELSLEAPSSSSTSSGLDLPAVTDGERTYSAFLPKADLHQVKP